VIQTADQRRGRVTADPCKITESPESGALCAAKDEFMNQVKIASWCDCSGSFTVYCCVEPSQQQRHPERLVRRNNWLSVRRLRGADDVQTRTHGTIQPY
jgi:hypothetical protein